MPSPKASRQNWGKAVDGIKQKAKQRKMEHAKKVLEQYRNAVKSEDDDMERKIAEIENKNVASDIVSGKDQDDTPDESESEDEVDFTDIIAEKMAKMKIKRAKAETKRTKKKKPEPEPEESESESSESEEEEEPKPKKGRGKKSKISVNVYNQQSEPSKKEKSDIEKCFLKF